MAPHSSTLAWRIPGMGEPGGLTFMGSHRVEQDWSDLAAAVSVFLIAFKIFLFRSHYSAYIVFFFVFILLGFLWTSEPVLCCLSLILEGSLSFWFFNITCIANLLILFYDNWATGCSTISFTPWITSRLSLNSIDLSKALWFFPPLCTHSVIC